MPPSVTHHTPLERLLLIQLIPDHGIEPASFVTISERITNVQFVRDNETFDAERLTSGALQELFLHLLREEIKLAEGKSSGDKAPGSFSPNSKKRKLPSPPVRTLTEARGHLAKLAPLDERLYAEYKQHMTREIQEDERRELQLQKEIRELEALEEADKAQKVAEQRRSPAEEHRAGVNGNQAVAPAINAGAHEANGASSSPAPIPGPSTQAPVRVSPLLPRQAPPVGSSGGPPAPPAFAPPNILAPGPGLHPSLGATPREAPKPATIAGPILQAPQGAVPFPPRSGSSTPQPPGTETPRAEPVARPKGTPQPNIPSTAPNALKWEPLYTPNQSQRAGSGPAHPSSKSPVAGRATPGAPQHQHGAQAMQPPFAVSNVPAQQQQQLRQHQPVLAAPQPPPNLAAPNVTGFPPAQPLLSTNSQQQMPHAAQLHPTSGRGALGHAQGSPSPQARASPVASPNPAIGARPSVPQQRQQGPLHGQQLASVGAPAVSSFSPAASFGDPAAAGTPHGLINPPHSRLGQRSVADPLAPRGATAPVFNQPQRFPHAPVTPLNNRTTPLVIPRGSGTRWKTSVATPSTPNPGAGEVESPQVEPLSPPLVAAQLASYASRAQGQQVPPNTTPAPAATASRRRGKAVGTSHGGSQEGVAQTADGTRIKNEDDATLRQPEETGDTTAEESGPSRRQTATPVSVSTRPIKRKRANSATEDLHPPPPPGTIAPPPTHVLWTRGFPKISASALDQITSHKNANMFASKIKDKDAPGYSNIVLNPVDLKSIKAAIQQGNRAAIAASTTLPDGDPGTSSVWLPISEELIPPRGIINSSQLECELVHMFANAIMYNPDPRRGVGSAFLIKAKGGQDEGGEDANALGYAVDQDAVVNDSRTMYIVVMKQLTELRSAERNPPPLPSGTTGTGANTNPRPSLMSFGMEVDPAATEDDGEQAASTTEAEGSGTIKRRRIARN